MFDSFISFFFLHRKLVGEGMILSTDDFFVTGGRYKFDVTKLSDAHDWSHQKCKTEGFLK